MQLFSFFAPPGILFQQVAFGEIDDMIETVDRNKDGKISYSEFRVGARQIDVR